MSDDQEFWDFVEKTHKEVMTWPAWMRGGEEMSDPKRIEIICKKLQQAWETVPDYRLGQLVSNLLGSGSHDVFFVEDNEWEKLLDKMIGGKFDRSKK